MTDDIRIPTEREAKKTWQLASEKNLAAQRQLAVQKLAQVRKQIAEHFSDTNPPTWSLVVKLHPLLREFGHAEDLIKEILDLGYVVIADMPTSGFECELEIRYTEDEA